MALLSISLLGSFQVRIGKAQITKLESNKVRALLAYLVVERDQAHSREKLAALIWPDMPPQRANANLSHALYNLRMTIQDHKANPPFLLRSREAVQFNPDCNYWLDTEAFIDQVDHYKTQDRVHLEKLQEAVGLYRGEFLEGLVFDSSLAFDEWILIQRQRLQRRLMDGLYHLADSHAEQGETAKALPFAWRQVEQDPLNERACRQLMRLLAASGQRSQALAQFNRLQILLAEELNITPEPETVALRDCIRNEQYLPTLDKPKRDNLPAFLTPFIGRKAEIAEIHELCDNPDCRLLTILGPGGSGKTRLVLEVARSRRENFQHGAFFVPLNPVQSQASIIPTIVEALDLPRSEQDDQQNQLINYLRGKNLLLIMDGFEHLLDGAGLMADILHQAPGVKILVTSRTRLNIKGEHLYVVGGMHYPESETTDVEIWGADAIQLLVTGLQRTRPEYSPTDEDSYHLLEICQQVMGMPLGILLAASWGATLSIGEIAEMAGRSIDFLAADWADVPARQRSLRATFDYTWNLLAEREKTIFQSLSVFRGAFTRRAAQAVSGASPHELRSLKDRSLILSKIPGWFEVHELLRQFGREKLALSVHVEQTVCGLHGDYYLGQLERLGDDLKGEKQVSALNSIDLEHENYRAAWNWAAEQGSAAQLAVALEALSLYYDLSLRYADGENASRAAIEGLTQGQDDVDLWLLKASALTWQSRFTRLLGRLELASELLDNALVHLEKFKASGNNADNSDAFLTLEQGNNHFHNDRGAATTCYRKSLKIYRRIENTWGTAKALSRLGFVAHHAGNFREAVEIYTESLEINRKLGDPRGIANAIIGAGQNSLRLGLREQGEQYINEGITVLQQIGDQAGVARGNFELGRYYFWGGDFVEAYRVNAKATPIFKSLGMLEQYTFSSIGTGLILSHLGEYAETISIVEKGIGLAQELVARREIGLAYVILGMAYLGKGEFKQAKKWASQSVEQYRDLNQKEELSLALAILVYTQLGLGQSLKAKLYLCEILQIGISISGVYPILYILFAASLILIKSGDIEKGLEIFTLAKRFPFVVNSRWFEDIAGREINAAAECVWPEVVTAARERGKKRDIWETAKELLDELREKVS